MPHGFGVYGVGFVDTFCLPIGNILSIIKSWVVGFYCSNQRRAGNQIVIHGFSTSKLSSSYNTIRSPLLACTIPRFVGTHSVLVAMLIAMRLPNILCNFTPGILAPVLVPPIIKLSMTFTSHTSHGNSCRKSLPMMSRSDSFMNTGVPKSAQTFAISSIHPRWGTILFFELPVSAPITTHFQRLCSAPVYGSNCMNWSSSVSICSLMGSMEIHIALERFALSISALLDTLAPNQQSATSSSPDMRPSSKRSSQFPYRSGFFVRNK